MEITACRKTAANEIVQIERIKKKQIYILYYLKREATFKKYGSRFVGKELMLSHETSLQNIKRYPGKHGNLVVVLEKLFLFYSTAFFNAYFLFF